jgi:hypothetical protein
MVLVAPGHSFWLGFGPGFRDYLWEDLDPGPEFPPPWIQIRIHILNLSVVDPNGH